MTLSEANARLAVLCPRRQFCLRLEQWQAGTVQWAVWDGLEWFHGPTLEFAVKNCESTHQLGSAGSLVAAEQSLAMV